LSDPLISCLCVTRNRLRLLRRAVACFHAQTYAERELIAVYEADDVETREYLRAAASDGLRVFEVPVDRKRTLGELRNYTVEVSRGDYVCQWDDDDWYGDDRLAAQMRALLESGKAACVLSRWICLDAVTRTAFMARRRDWEGSLLCRKSALPSYRHLARGEDTSVVAQLGRSRQLARLDRPDLYVYTFHGGNTWDRAHWIRVLHRAVPLGDAETRRVIAVSESDQVAPVATAPSAYLADTRRAFDEAIARRPDGVRQWWGRFAGRPVRLRVVGPMLAEHVNAAFEHLRVDEDDATTPALTVDLWDRAYTGVGCPGVPFAPDSTIHLDDGLITRFGGDEVLRYEQPRAVTCLDRVGQILSCRVDGDKLALHERSKPFPLVLAAWYQQQEIQQVHAGLVGRDGHGILFVGNSGSGKSTCALACALADFDFLGDDYVGLEAAEDGVWWGHSYYAAARVDAGHLERLPALRQYHVKSAFEWEPKGMVLVPRVAEARVAARARVAAAVMPRFAGPGPTRMTRASKVEMLIALTSTTLRLPLSPGLPAWLKLGDLVERLPCYRLEIGDDVTQIPSLVGQVLAEATR